jgi:hypothetical protein
MLGIMLVVSGFVILLAVISLDIIHIIRPSSRFGKFGRRLSESAKTNIAAYELPFLIMMMGFPSFVGETQIPVFLDFVDSFPNSWMTAIVWIPGMFAVAMLNIARCEPFGLAKKNEEHIYALAEELIGYAESPEQGIEAALDYIRENSKSNRNVSDKVFLKRLVSHGGDVAVVAAKRLEDTRPM